MPGMSKWKIKAMNFTQQIYRPLPGTARRHEKSKGEEDDDEEKLYQQIIINLLISLASI